MGKSSLERQEGQVATLYLGLQPAGGAAAQTRLWSGQGLAGGGGRNYWDQASGQLGRRCVLTALTQRGCSWKCGGQLGRTWSASLSRLHPELHGLCPELGVACGLG